MMDKVFDTNVKQTKRLRTVAILLGALYAPLVTHAADIAAEASVQDGEMKDGEMKDGEMKDGEMKHGEMKDDKMSHGSGEGHSHKQLDISSWASQPSVSMKVETDAMSGLNIYIEPQNFQFAPESVNSPIQEGEGHAHLYVNDKKVARLYGSWFHLPALPAGTHSIKIQLTANDHSTLALGNNPIEFISTVVVEE